MSMIVNKLTDFSKGLKNLGLFGIVFISVEDIALIFAFCDAFVNKVYSFLVIQDISILPMVMNGIFIYYYVHRFAEKLKNNICKKEWYLYSFWCTVLFIVLITLSIVTCKMTGLTYLVKWPWERIILLFLDLAYIIIIEVCKKHLADFIIKQLNTSIERR